MSSGHRTFISNMGLGGRCQPKLYGLCVSVRLFTSKRSISLSSTDRRDAVFSFLFLFLLVGAY